MSELVTLARPYAAAAFERAKETQATDKWSASLAFLSAVVSDGNMQALIGNPKFGKDKLAALLLEVCQDQLEPETTNFLKLLIQNNRLALVPYIAHLFENHKADDENRIDVAVSTAFALSKEAEKKLATELEKLLSKKVRMAITVDKSLIGGVLIRAGDRVIDRSVRGQLQHMQKALH
jgi:F-type H+-transporting ATPase subunit delta